MKLITEREASQINQVECDICIIGSGPAGTTLAEQLASTGKKIVIVESGIDEPNDQIQKLNTFSCTGHPVRKGFINRLRMIGGSSNLWPGRCMPLEPIDFDARSWVPNSGWPIAYSEYASYLEQAATVLKIPNSDIKKYVADQQVFDSNVKQPTLSAKLAIWGKGAKRFRENFSDGLNKCPNITLFRGFTASEFIFTEDGNTLHKIAVTTVSKKQVFIKSGTYISACGGIENARLLLLAKLQNPFSKFDTYNVGRFFMDHPRVVQGKVELNKGVDWSAFIGHPIHGGLRQFGIGLSDKYQEQHQVLNSYVYLEPHSNELIAKSYDSTIQSLKRVLRKGHTGNRLDFSNPTKVKDMVYQLTPKEILPNWLYRIYFGLRSLIKPHKRHLVVINHCEQAPDPDSRLTLGEETDMFGNPLAILHWKINEIDRASVISLHQAVAKWVNDEGLGKFISEPGDLCIESFEDASHHIGTTRISTTAINGVVDTNLKAHNIDNLYLCGSSVFPTSGSGNPTLSIVALAIRLAEHLKKTIQ